LQATASTSRQEASACRTRSSIVAQFPGSAAIAARKRSARARSCGWTNAKALVSTISAMR
jgi:hypothetical protein